MNFLIVYSLIKCKKYQEITKIREKAHSNHPDSLNQERGIAKRVKVAKDFFRVM